MYSMVSHLVSGLRRAPQFDVASREVIWSYYYPYALIHFLLHSIYVASAQEDSII